ncbi:MAG: serine protease [Pontixanthobacter sp.]
MHPATSAWRLAVAFLAAVTGAVFVFLVLIARADIPPPQGSTVKINVAGGHGSGVQIAPGLILTAWHVVNEPGYLEIEGERGRVYEAERLWANQKYDIALIRIEQKDAFASSRLDCRPLRTGEPIIALGSPLQDDFLEMRGIVAGAVRSFAHWAAVVPADMTVLWGMSGGPAFDRSGNLVGINVGTGVKSMGFAATWVRIGYIVPADVICQLLARA